MFANDKEKQEAIRDVTGLKEHPGWKWLEKALSADVAAFETQLRERRDFGSLEEVYRTQDLRDATAAFKNLPDKIVAAAKDEPPESEEESHDPFPQAAPDESAERK